MYGKNTEKLSGKSYKKIIQIVAGDLLDEHIKLLR